MTLYSHFFTTFLSMSYEIKISKTLPGGRTVHRLVPQNEFLTGGWAEQGWSAATVDAESLNDQAQEIIDDKAFKKLTENKDTLTLRGYMSPIKVFKTLPNGKRVYRKLYKGEYELNGWKNNGWRVTYDTSKPNWGSKATYGRKKVLADLKAQRWWRPQRSVSYARRIAIHHKVPFLPFNSELLRNPNYTFNPRYDTYTRRVRNYAYKHPTWKPFSDLPDKTEEEYKEYWDTIREEFNRVKHTKTPDPIIPYKTYRKRHSFFF